MITENKYNYTVYGQSPSAYTTTGYYYPSKNTLSLQMDFEELSVNAETMTSTLKASVYIKHLGLYIGQKPVKLYWNNVLVASFSGRAIQSDAGARSLLGTITFTVPNSGASQGTLKAEVSSLALEYTVQGTTTKFSEQGCSGDITLSPVSLVPPTGTLSITEGKGSIAALGLDGYVGGFSQIALNALNLHADGGKTIKTINISIDGQTVQKSPSDLPYTISNLAEGNHLISMSATDSANITGELGSETIKVYGFVGATLSVTTKRCDAQGESDDEGTYASCKLSFTKSYIKDGSTTILTLDPTSINITANGQTHSVTVGASPITTILSGFSTTSSYQFEYEYTDAVKETVATDVLTRSFYTVDFAAGGRGVAVGMAATPEYFDIGLKARVQGSPIGVVGTAVLPQGFSATAPLYNWDSIVLKAFNGTDWGEYLIVDISGNVVIQTVHALSGITITHSGETLTMSNTGSTVYIIALSNRSLAWS